MQVRGSSLFSLLLVISSAVALNGQIPTAPDSLTQSEEASAPQVAELGTRPSLDATEGVIRLDVVVTDKSGKAVTGLEAKDFTLLDNGQPSRIVSFHAFDGVVTRPDPPVEVVLVVDNMSLSGPQASRAQSEFEKLLRENGGRTAQPVSIYRLSNFGLTASAQPSTDGNVLAEEMAHAREPRTIWQSPRAAEGPHGDLPGGISRTEFSLKALCDIAIEERRNPGRKLLFWPGSGWPVGKGSVPFFDWVTEFSTSSREARLTLYGVTEWPLPKSEFSYLDFVKGARSAKDVVYPALSYRVLATQSGGQILAGNSLADLIGKEAEEANAFYTLTFDPVRTSVVDEYHDLKVEVANPDLTANTDTGYYDQPVFYDQPAPAQRVTVEQLEQMLGKANGGDKDVAQELAGMEFDRADEQRQVPGLEGPAGWRKILGCAGGAGRQVDVSGSAGWRHSRCRSAGFGHTACDARADHRVCG